MVMNNTMNSITDQDLLKEKPVSLFSPNNPSPTQTIFLSNIDQAVAFPVETVFFYSAPPSTASADIGEKVKKAVEEVLLIPYYFMAGRLNFNVETERLELMCNNAGALFVSAESRLSLKDIGDLSQPNPTFHRFVHRPGLYGSLAETAVFTIQVTMFNCGGFAIGFTTNHAILDGKSATAMFLTLAAICRGDGPKTAIINSDRTSIKARTPPQILFPHQEYAKLDVASSFTSHKRTSPCPSIFSEKHTHRLFNFTPRMLQLLKEKSTVKCSTFEAILAHVWRVRTRAVFHSDDQREKLTMVLFAVDVREKISPPLQDSFAGNAVLTAFASAVAGELVDGPLGFGVEKVREGRERVTAEYVRSAVDWLEVKRGIPATSDGGAAFYVSAWWKLPFWEVDVGFGRPVHCGPVASGNDEFALLLADGGGDNNGGYCGINVWMGLEREKMERFSSCVFKI